MNTWEIQARNFITSKKANVEFCLLEFCATEIVTWKFHMDKSTKGMYDIITGRNLLTDLGLDLKLYDHVIVHGKVPYEGFPEPMVDVSNYN